MKVIETHLKGCFIIEPTIFDDGRGSFFESFNLKNSYLPGTTYANKIRFTLNLQGLTLGKIITSLL
jgi:dTDP-4-dehydrorhamnose 3,5-epimerase-like enzyme